MPFRTLLIEDQRLFLSLLESHFASHADFELVAKASDGAEGVRVFEETRPDLVLLDIVLPVMDGFEAAERILALDPEANILAITSQMDSSTTNRIHAAGFHGYVEKEQPIEILEEAMTTVAEGGLYFTQLVRENRYRIGQDRSVLSKVLSAREQGILYWVGEGLTSQAIADKLQLSVRTVENHRHRIMKKLNLFTASEMIKFAIQHGLESPQ